MTKANVRLIRAGNEVAIASCNVRSYAVAVVQQDLELRLVPYMVTRLALYGVHFRE